MKAMLSIFAVLFSLSSMAKDMEIVCESQNIDHLNNFNVSATTISLNEQTNRFEGNIVINLRKSGFDSIRFEKTLFVEGIFNVVPAGIFGPKPVTVLTYVNPNSDHAKLVRLLVDHPSKRSSEVLGEDGYSFRSKCIEVQTSL